MDLHVKSVKVICAECRDQGGAHRFISASNLQFFRCAPNCQVVDDDLALVQSAMGYSSQFSELKIAQVLDANPDTDSQHGKHEAKGTARRPQQEQTQHGEDC